MATSRVPHGEKRKTKIETAGGENHPAHEDAIKVAEAQAKLKKSGTKALSNKELQEVANRIQLEERVSLLTASSGRKFVRKHLTNQSDASGASGSAGGGQELVRLRGKERLAVARSPLVESRLCRSKNERGRYGVVQYCSSDVLRTIP
jgi:hypothetical protein